MELAKIKAGISRIDPVVGMENWEIRIEGLHRKFNRPDPAGPLHSSERSDSEEYLRSEFHDRWEAV